MGMYVDEWSTILGQNYDFITLMANKCQFVVKVTKIERDIGICT
jgi:hypothetical protein